MNELMMFEHGNQVVVSSRVIADRFEKRHDHVLDSIRNLIVGIPKSGDTPERYFVHTEYRNEQNHQIYPEYLCTRDGFSLLAMGFTGDTALKWKLKYIQTFNAMEALIRERQTTDWLQTREKGKLIRRDETDAIQLLISYAEEQGSKNAKMFYTNYSKMVNKAVGLEAGQRDTASHKTLMLVALMEDIISNTILEEMEKGVYYKHIYQICKNKINSFVGLTYLKVS